MAEMKASHQRLVLGGFLGDEGSPRNSQLLWMVAYRAGEVAKGGDGNAMTHSAWPRAGRKRRCEPAGGVTYGFPFLEGDDEHA